MRKFSILAVAAILGFPALASAEYAKTGVIEIGGEVAISNDSRATKPKGGTETTETTTSITLAPEVGYFLMDQLELLGRLAITNSSTDNEGDKSSSSAFGLGVGAAYMLPVSTIFVGPRGTIGFSSATSGSEGDTLTVSGPEIRLGGVAKVLFGNGPGGILGAGLDITYAPQSLSGAGAFKDVEGDSTLTGFGISTSFSVYW
jgi:hypothetical protein